MGRETRAILRRWTHCAHWTHWTRASPGSRRLSLCLVPVDMMFLTSAFTATALEDQVLLNGEVQQQGGG